VKVYLRNATKNEENYAVTNDSGEFVFDLANFSNGYSSGDSLKLRAELGSFYKEESTTLSGDSWEQDLTLGLDTNYIKFDLLKMKEELIIWLRNNIEDRSSRLTNKTDVFTADGSTVEFNLSENNGKNVRWVSVGGAIQTRYEDYYVDYKDKTTLNSPKVYFLTPPSSGVQVEVNYDYGTDSWVYPDFPRTSLKTDDYPRMRADLSSLNVSEFSFGAGANSYAGTIEISVWAKSAYDVDDIVNELRWKLFNSKKSFRYIDLITPSSIGGLVSTPERGDKIVQRDCEYSIRLKVDTV